jgi:Domain of unknown function (DUF5664)
VSKKYYHNGTFESVFEWDTETLKGRWVDPATGKDKGWSAFTLERLLRLNIGDIEVFPPWAEREKVNVEQRYRWFDAGSNIAWWRWDNVTQTAVWIGKYDVDSNECSGHTLDEVLSFDDWHEIDEPKYLPSRPEPVSEKEDVPWQSANGWKSTNPKDAVGVTKPPIHNVPLSVLTEVGMAMNEGEWKYGGYNWRVIGVRASVYWDATFRHLGAWWEGEDDDPQTGLNHITKAISALIVLRDAMIQGKFNDDRPPRSKQSPAVELARFRDMQARLEKDFPTPAEGYTQKGLEDAP